MELCNKSMLMRGYNVGVNTGEHNDIEVNGIARSWTRF